MYIYKFQDLSTTCILGEVLLGLSQMANFKQPKYFRLCHQFLLHKPKNTEYYHLGVHFNVTIVSLHVNFSCSFTGCVHGVKVECPHCGSGVQGTIVALYRLMEMYNTKSRARASVRSSIKAPHVCSLQSSEVSIICEQSKCFHKGIPHDGEFILPRELLQLTVYIKSGLRLTSADSDHTAWLVMHSSYTTSIKT